MNPLGLVKLTALMERTGGSPDVKVGLIDGPVATRHPDLVGTRFLRASRKSERDMRTGRQHSVSARDLCRRDPVRQAQFLRSRHLPGLHPRRAPHFC